MATEFYAGIGSRETPDNVLQVMQVIGYHAALRGYVLRSGGANGADSAFEMGCDRDGGPKEIYLPWDGFNGRKNNLSTVFSGVSNEALCLASRFHPNWTACSNAARKLHARNCYQILGLSLDKPVTRVICWTKNASSQGGTGQALRIAKHHNIEIHDLGDDTILRYYRQLFGL